MARQWTVALIAKEFHQLPSVVAKDLDEDPERLSAICLQLLKYREAKAVFDRAGNDSKSDEMKAWASSKMMKAVINNAFDLEKERRAKK